MIFTPSSLFLSTARLHSSHHDIRRFAPYPPLSLVPPPNTCSNEHSPSYFEEEYSPINKTPLLCPSRNIRYISSSSPPARSFSAHTKAPVDLNNNNSSSFIDREAPLMHTRKMSSTSPGPHSPYNAGKHSPLSSPYIVEQKSPISPSSYKNERMRPPPVYSERHIAPHHHHHRDQREQTPPRFSPSHLPATSHGEYPQRFSPQPQRPQQQYSPPSRFSFSEPSSPLATPPKAVKQENNEDDSEVDSIDMLVRLFPLQKISTLRNVLEDHNSDPVKAIEYLLYGKTSSTSTKEASPFKQTFEVSSFIDHESEDSLKSKNKKSKNIINDDLSSLAKAYDIQVPDERIVVNQKIVHW